MPIYKNIFNKKICPNLKGTNVRTLSQIKNTELTKSGLEQDHI